jgi:hypothetical protein
MLHEVGDDTKHLAFKLDGHASTTHFTAPGVELIVIEGIDHVQRLLAYASEEESNFHQYDANVPHVQYKVCVVSVPRLHAAGHTRVPLGRCQRCMP